MLPARGLRVHRRRARTGGCRRRSRASRCGAGRSCRTGTGRSPCTGPDVATLAHARGDAEFTAGGAPVALVTPGGARGVPRGAPLGLGQRVRAAPRHRQRRAARGLPARRRASRGAGRLAGAAVRAQAVAARTYVAFERPTPAATPTTSATPTSARSTAAPTGSTPVRRRRPGDRRPHRDVRRQARVRAVLRQQRRLQRRRHGGDPRTSGPREDPFDHGVPPGPAGPAAHRRPRSPATGPAWATWSRSRSPRATAWGRTAAG